MIRLEASSNPMLPGRVFLLRPVIVPMLSIVACLLVAACDTGETDLDRCNLQLINAAERLVDSPQQEITFSCGAKLPEPYVIIAADGPVEKEELVAAGVNQEDTLFLAGAESSWGPGRSYLRFVWGASDSRAVTLRVPVVGHLIAVKKPLERATFTIRKRGQMLEIVDLR